MTCTADGFSAWGKDIGGYSSNPEVAAENEEIYHHQTGGMAEDGTTVEFDALNDRGYDCGSATASSCSRTPSTAPMLHSLSAAGLRLLDKYADA